MNGVEYVRELCKKHGIAVSTLEKELKFSNGYLNPKKMEYLPYDRAVLVRKKIGGDIAIMTGVENEESPIYYTNEETAAVAQKIFEEDKVLFDVYRSSDKERLIEYAKKLKALRDMEEGNL